ncbi:MAG: hypothetical protein ACPGVB_02500 [Chitinophagales bacterium]
MKPPIYQTPRFTLQSYTPKDEDRFVEMSLDPVSVEFMGGAEGIEEEERALFQRIFKVYEKKEVTRWIENEEEKGENGYWKLWLE